MEGSYPKYVFNKNGEPRLIKTAEEHEALERAEPRAWAESPKYFGADGLAVDPPHRPARERRSGGAPTAPGAAYPKWLYHRDGKRERVVNSQKEHEALVDRDDWLESPNQSAALQSNSIANAEPPGQSLYETPVRDVVEMLRGASLEVLEKTFSLEERNPGGARKTLLRELSDLIEDAQRRANADPQE